MLQDLYIRDFAIVPKLELHFEPALTVLTGETGAGKSIVIDALALVLGARADSTVIRHGAERTEIAASFALSKKHDAAHWLQDHDLFADEECIVRRVLERDKPSKGFINGRPVTMQQLRELGDFLVDIHGQHEHQSLLKREAQRQLLDDYAGLTEEVVILGGHYEQLHRLEARLETLQQQSSDREARIDLLRYQVKELKALNLQPNEWAQLEEEHARLANGAELLEGAQSAAQQLYDDDEQALSRSLGQITASLEKLSDYDPKLGEVGQLLREALIQIDEAASTLHHYLDGLELDPQRLQWLDDRLGTAHDLARKHHATPEELPDLLTKLETELNDIEDFDHNLEKLQVDISAQRETYMKLAKTISKKRQQAAKQLSGAVTETMQELGLAGGTFEVALEAAAEGKLSAGGLERAEFLVSANPGQPRKPLNKVASGGELSRISLAIQVVIASLGRIPTLIFDEVDVGVGGRVAEIVGQLLRELGKNRQVLCITHLAQVAALGHHHLQVQKASEANETRVSVRPLPNEERVQEIARMIGGIEISAQTLAHAEEMLTRATA